MTTAPTGERGRGGATMPMWRLSTPRVEASRFRQHARRHCTLHYQYVVACGTFGRCKYGQDTYSLDSGTAVYVHVTAQKDIPCPKFFLLTPQCRSPPPARDPRLRSTACHLLCRSCTWTGFAAHSRRSRARLCGSHWILNQTDGRASTAHAQKQSETIYRLRKKLNKKVQHHFRIQNKVGFTWLHLVSAF